MDAGPSPPGGGPSSYGSIAPFEEDIGELQVSRLIDFTLGSVGAIADNQGIADAQAYLQGKLLDLEIDVHEPVEYESKP